MGTNAAKVIRYNKGYVVLLARVADIAVQTFVWRDYDITISAQCGLAIRAALARGAKPPRWARVLNRALNWLEPGHCELAIACDIDRAEQALRILKGDERP